MDTNERCWKGSDSICLVARVLRFIPVICLWQTNGNPKLTVRQVVLPVIRITAVVICPLHNRNRPIADDSSNVAWDTLLQENTGTQVPRS